MATKPTPSVLGRVVGALPGAALGALSALRGRRIFHPVGVAYAATCTVPQTDPDAQILPVGEHEAIVRFSRGAGLPAGLPDALGVAVKLPRLGAAGGDQHFLLTSSAGLPAARRLIVPRAGFAGRRFSSILAYRFRGGPAIVVGAEVSGADTRLDDPDAAPTTPVAAVHLQAATLLGEWRPVATIGVRERLPAPDADDLRFDPWQTSEDLRPTGVLNAVRGPAYTLSQLARAFLGWREAKPEGDHPRIERVPLSD